MQQIYHQLFSEEIFFLKMTATTDLTSHDSELTVQNSPPRQKAKNFNAECVIMRTELSGITINYAQELL